MILFDLASTYYSTGLVETTNRVTIELSTKGSQHGGNGSTTNPDLGGGFKDFWIFNPILEDMIQLATNKKPFTVHRILVL